MHLARALVSARAVDKIDLPQWINSRWPEAGWMTDDSARGPGYEPRRRFSAHLPFLPIHDLADMEHA